MNHLPLHHPMWGKSSYLPINTPTLQFVERDGRFEPVNVLARAFCHIACVSRFERWQVEELGRHGFRVEVTPQTAAAVARRHLAAYSMRPTTGPRHVDDHA